MSVLVFVFALAAVEPADLVVPGLAGGGGAAAGALVASGLAAGALAFQFANPVDVDEPFDPARVLFNQTATFLVLIGPALFSVVGAGLAGYFAQGLVVALGAGFGASVGAGAGTLLGLVTLPPGREADGGEAVLEMVGRGGIVALTAAIGAAVGAAGAMAALPPEGAEAE